MGYSRGCRPLGTASKQLYVVGILAALGHLLDIEIFPKSQTQIFLYFTEITNSGDGRNTLFGGFRRLLGGPRRRWGVSGGSLAPPAPQRRQGQGTTPLLTVTGAILKD